MSYGLLETGFVRPTAAEIRARLVADITAIQGFANVRTSSGSVLGNLIDAFVDELSSAWEAIEAAVQAFSRDDASGISLDNLMTLIAKARTLAEYSTVDLTLYSFETGIVTVPEGNQASQSATGLVWETTEDAEIPAGVTILEDLAVGAIAWQSATTVRYSLPAATDLSLVVAGDLLIVSDSAVSGNNGAFAITTVNNGADWVEATNPNRTSSTGDEADSAATASLTDAHITVAAQSTVIGAYTATAQSVDTISTPVADWAGVVNLADGTVGQDTEEDADFKARVAEELTIAQGSTLEAIKAKLRNVDGVTYVSAEENRTAAVADGLLPHSQRFVVVGGTDQNIIDCLGTYKAAGIATNGDESGTYTDPEGVTSTLYFDRVTQIDVWIIVNLTVDADYPATGDAAVSTALLALNDSLEHGEDLKHHELIGAIYVAAIPGIVEMEVLLGLSDPPTLEANITIGATELALLVAEQITVNS